MHYYAFAIYYYSRLHYSYIYFFLNSKQKFFILRNILLEIETQNPLLWGLTGSNFWSMGANILLNVRRENVFTLKAGAGGPGKGAKKNIKSHF